MKTMLEDQAITRRKLSDEVKDRLLSLIEDGQMQAGDQLPSERELMNRFKVGRPAVREALQSLQGMGLIEISHGERARVTALDPHSLIDQLSRPALHMLQKSPEMLEHLKEARLMFELGMVRFAARRASAEDIQRLREALDRHLESLQDQDKARFVQCDMAFHTTIASISGNPIYSAISEAMLQWLFEFHTELLRVAGAEHLTLDEHQQIFDAIAARDEERAAQAMTAHLKRSSPLYRVSEAEAAGTALSAG
jgi:GntR family transcriptional regulator, sialic acid-inducible nan operon repressor